MSADIARRRFWNHEKTPKDPRNPAETSRSAASELPDAYLFLGWTLDLRRHALSKAGEEHHLRVKTYDVLVYLARHAGRVVGKQELLDAVWGDVAVTEDSLVQCLVEIRRTLGDAQDAVKTVRGRGYLLDAHVETHPAAPPVVTPFRAPVSGAPSTTSQPTPERSHRPSRLWMIAIAGVLAVVVMLAVTQAMRRPQVSSSAGPQMTMSPEAREAVDEGWRLSRRLSRVDLQESRAAFARAIAADPGYAPAHAALASGLTALSVFGVERPADVLPEALTEGRRAVELDPTLSPAWTALGHALVQGAWDWTQGEAAYRRAIALDPRDHRPRFLMAHLLTGIGRTSEALSESLRGRELAPDSAQMAASNGIVLYWARQHEAARDAFRHALHLDRSATLAHFWMALNEVSLGDLDGAMTAALAARDEMANAPTWVIGYVHAAAGRRAEAVEVLGLLEAHRTRTYVSATEFAFLHAGLGQNDQALDWLERGFQERARWMEIIGVIPVMDPLRDHPRFKKILHAMNLPGGS